MATALQLGLAVTGGVILIGVVAYNTWNARRNAPRRARPDRAERGVSPRANAAPPSPVREPVLGTAAGAPDNDARIEPVLGGQRPVVGQIGPFSATLVPPDRRTPLDALIDVIVPIAFDGKPVSGEALIAALPATRRVGSKPFAVEGQNNATGHWEFPMPGQRYRAAKTGVQLANRTGPLNEIGYSEFVVTTQAYADAVGGAPEFPEMLDQVARARELDQFASSHDAQLNFTLRARGAVWSPGYVQQQAGRFGFVPGAIPGRLVLPALEAGLPPLLDLSFDAQAALAAADGDQAHVAIRSVTLGLDVPQVPRENQPYTRLTETALALAQSMNGVITDDVGQPLESRMIESIGADLERLYDTLEAHDLAAGSPQARRLFS
ncbi:MAG: cell division protein FtsZ [Burkholderiaceae bacterium]|jgi:hypothetical protein|nr:cell division protein FtsZ [Burkholderiaceae bacterium]